MVTLKRKFFNRPTLKVAEELLGKKLVFNRHEGIITETEAYIGEDDPACHAAKGMTPRTKVMFGPAGFSYVYLIYGMYHCLNFVTEKEGFPAAVLIRGIYIEENNLHLDGPGKLCKFLGITKKNNEIDLTESKDFFVSDSKLKLKFKTTPRIGISSGKEKPWRFVAEDIKNQIK